MIDGSPGAVGTEIKAPRQGAENFDSDFVNKNVDNYQFSMYFHYFPTHLGFSSGGNHFFIKLFTNFVGYECVPTRITFKKHIYVYFGRNIKKTKKDKITCLSIPMGF